MVGQVHKEKRCYAQFHLKDRKTMGFLDSITRRLADTYYGGETVVMLNKDEQLVRSRNIKRSHDVKLTFSYNSNVLELNNRVDCCNICFHGS